MSLSNLPEIAFAELSPAKVEQEIISRYEALTGKTLYPGDPVRLFLLTLAYVITVQNQTINRAGLQNLLAYAVGPHLDHLGAFMGVERLPARKSGVTLRFSLSEALNYEAVIPAGVRVTTLSGSPLFALVQAAVIPAGETLVDIQALCVEPGESGEGLLPGQIARLVDPQPYPVTVANTDVSGGGSDAEDDERYRERIRLAPESYTNAGSVEAYQFHALSVSQDILAVTVQSPVPGVVDVRFVMRGGELPGAADIELVRNALSGEKVRPLTDTVLVDAPDVVEYELDGQYFVSRADASLLSGISKNVEKAVEEYRLWQRAQPGRDINPDKLVQLLREAGAKRVTLASPAFTALSSTQIARETAFALTFGGLENE
jgi:phage-related baseplate assembly protein